MLGLVAPGKVAVGNSAGWALTFHGDAPGPELGKKLLEIDSGHYHAEIEASMPAGLEGGRYKFVIEGMTDSDYGEISGQQAKVVRLHLLWRDVNQGPGAYLANVAGLGDMLAPCDARTETLVAELAVKTISRRVGGRRYEVVVEAWERVFERLSRRLPAAADGRTILDAIKAIGKALGVTVETTDVTPRAGTPPPEGAQPEKYTADGGLTGVAEIQRLAGLLEQAHDKFGRGMLLIRNGKLLAGERDMPPKPKSTVDLDPTGGLVQAEPMEPLVIDRDAFEADPTTGIRAQFKLTLKGRPDLQPGDIVTFKPVPEDDTQTGAGIAGALGALASGLTGGLFPDLAGGKQLKLYVSSVEHRLGRTAGFSTAVTGVKVVDESDVWDSHSRRRPDGPGRTASTSADGQAADAIARHVASAQEGRRTTEVGEVRSFTASGSGEPPSQTETVWRGLRPADGQPNQARRLAPERDNPSPVLGVPVATPFAWGKTGLVVPRYPGTRIVLEHRDGRAEDAIDIGALWESGKGPSSQAGDWWLILPVGVAQSARSTLPDTRKTADGPEKATNDLIDADGHRVIEVGELTVRVKGELGAPGKRPERTKDEGSVTIEHTGGASIVMKSDGSVLITGKKVSIDAGSGDIEMKANNVKVTVAGSMDVSG
jgi:hypothetical protein